MTQCAFSTTKPEGAFRQAARRGSPTRYKRCRNTATTTFTFTESSLAAGVVERTVECCALHKRKAETLGWRP